MLEKTTKDFVAYIDTDSLFIKFEEFLFSKGVDPGKWKTYPDDKKIEAILGLSRHMEKYVDSCCFKELQQDTYNSIVEQDDFAIVFKQEVVCKSALFIKKKKYGFHVVNKEGVTTDKIDVTGLEIIRSETPSAFKVILRDVLRFILENRSDKEILDFVDKSKEEIMSKEPNEISSNISVNSLAKYIVDGEPVKGTPYHVKGAASYHKLLRLFGLEDHYPKIVEGDKASVLYIRPNRYDVEVISYPVWPKQFKDHGILPDYEKMIEKFLINKIRILLEPMNKASILDRNNSFSMFFN